MSEGADAEAVRAAREFFSKDRGCTCGAVDIGIGVMHEPGCGSPSADDLADLLLTREAAAREAERERDEARMDAEAQHAKAVHWAEKAGAFAKQIDELVKPLALARAMAPISIQMTGREADLLKRAEAAETARDHWKDRRDSVERIMRKERARAESAEARVKELEAAPLGLSALADLKAKAARTEQADSRALAAEQDAERLRAEMIKIAAERYESDASVTRICDMADAALASEAPGAPGRGERNP